MQITPLHLTASFSFFGVLRTEFDSSLTGITTEKYNLDDLCQEPAAEADEDSRRIRARGSFFLPLELVGALYEMGARRTISEVAPQILAIILAFGKDTPTYRKVLYWVQASITKVVWKNHATLSFWEGPIWTNWSWETSDFAATQGDTK